MKRRTFVKSSFALGAAAAAFPVFPQTGYPQSGSARTGRTDPPNILLIMADDMGFSDIGCYGGEIDTPNIDRLSRNGLNFTQFYNASRCCPTRASILTGLYQHQAGVGHMTDNKGYEAYRGYLNDECVTIAEALNPAGYHTLMSGKWHVGGRKGHWPSDRGFDETFALIGGASNYWKPGLMSRNGRKWRPEDDKRYREKDFYMTDAFTDYAVDFLEEYGKKENPFFLYLAYTAPHFPLHAWQEDIDKYKGRFDKGWDKLREERYKRQLELGIVKEKWPLTPRDERVTAWEDVSEKKKKDMLLRMEIYAAMVDRMDQGIGRVTAKLEELGIVDNTLILFLSDNGGNWEGGPWGWDWGKGKPGRSSNFWCTYGMSWGNLSNTPFRLYKHWVHEGGIATPFIAHWPAGIRSRGELTRQAGHIVDIMATCCDVAGVEYPKRYKGRRITPLEGESLLPALKGKQRKRDRALYWEHCGNKAVRKGKWKLVSRHRKKKWELYDMEADRSEMDDLSGDHTKKVKELKAMYSRWAERCGVRPWPVKKKKKR